MEGELTIFLNTLVVHLVPRGRSNTQEYGASFSSERQIKYLLNPLAKQFLSQSLFKKHFSLLHTSHNHALFRIPSIMAINVLFLSLLCLFLSASASSPLRGSVPEKCMCPCACSPSPTPTQTPTPSPSMSPGPSPSSSSSPAPSPSASPLPFPCELSNVCFAIEESRSVSSDDYRTAKNVVLDVARAIAQKSPASLFSAYGFSGRVSRIVESTSDLESTFKRALQKRRKLGGTVASGLGLRECLNEVKSGAGKRVIVLLVDGADRARPRGEDIAPSVKDAGVSVVTVGVGNQLPTAVLSAIATTEDDFYAFPSYTDLADEAVRVVRGACSVPVVAPSPLASPSPTSSSSPTPSSAPSVSSTPSSSPSSSPIASPSNSPAASPKPCAIDSVCFALDESGSINSAEFQQEKDAVSRVADVIASRSERTLYSAFGFSEVVSPIQKATLDLEGEFKPALARRLRDGEATASGLGLQECLKEIRSHSGTRVIVLLSDGADNRNPRGRQVAPSVKAEGVSIVTVGIGNQVSAPALRAIATSPEFFIPVSSFDQLPLAIGRIADGTCNLAPALPSPSPSPAPSIVPCTARSNICFAMDESGSISRREYIKERDAVARIADAIDARSSGTTYSAYGFTNTVSAIQTSTTDLNGVFKPALESRQRLKGGTSIGLGLIECFKEIRSKSDPRVVVLLSDGNDKRAPFGLDVAPALKADGISIVSVAIGEDASSSDLSKMASSPELFFPVEDFDVLLSAVETITNGICTTSM